MPEAKVAVTLDTLTLRRVDRLVEARSAGRSSIPFSATSRRGCGPC